MSRRDLLASVLGSAAAVATGGCDSASWWSRRLPQSGTIDSPDLTAGHRLRLPPADRLPERFPASDEAARDGSAVHDCVIVGGGVAGLSAAWHLARRGIDDFRVLELETHPGGTSRSGQVDHPTLGKLGFPWGAHYVPVPMANNPPLIKFLQEVGIATEVSPEGRVEISESHLCRDPQERVYAAGLWQAGLYPDALATSADRGQADRFRALMTQWAMRRDDQGRRLFGIPIASTGSTDETRRLDTITMADYLDQHGFDSRPLRWLVEHACRDDYGLSARQTSAWAGVFYFASRIAGEDGRSQPVMTWPEGNGYLVDRLRAPLSDRLQLGTAVLRMQREESGVRIETLDTRSGATWELRARRVILAVPQFIAGRLLPTDLSRVAPKLHYGSWLVANVHVDSRGDAAGLPLAWDSVMYGSPSLGYVTATHQAGVDHGPTVLTWYHALTGEDVADVRRRLMRLSWADAAELVLSDLETAHAEIRRRTTRIDVMRWGHAMVGPVVGTRYDPQRLAASRAIGPFHFAGTDLSGVALFEEAFDHGRRAAMEVGQTLGNEG